MRRHPLEPLIRNLAIGVLLLGLCGGGALAQEEDYETIGSERCGECHETGAEGTKHVTDLAHSVHAELDCLACHSDKGTIPHKPATGFRAGCEGCRDCHEEASKAYQAHGRAGVGESRDLPQCKDCHGSHDVLPSSARLSRTHPANLPETCGRCHQDLDITSKHDLIDRPIEVYANSVHGRATKGGVYVAATCNDCHSTAGTSHKIYGPGHPDSSINHFNIPKTCGKCHKGIEADFWEGIHGKLVARGETDAPVCTHCHGEHGIISPDDPRSPVSRARVAEETCSPCHESAVLNEKYGLPPGRLRTFIDSYHGLKSKAGDTHVANCASCHGVHRILPSNDPTSTIHPANLQHTCGECHPAISSAMAATPIHGVTGDGLRTPAAEVIEDLYIVAIVVIVGLMVLHWLIDLISQLRNLMSRKPQIRRMSLDEVWQHGFLAVSFIVLVISGFALRFSDSWISRLFFGWEGGFELRGVVHRVAAVVFMLTVIWHILFLLLTRRGKRFWRDMWPRRDDFKEVWGRLLHNITGRPEKPPSQRFNYVEKAEYWALVWGTGVMLATGLLLWFDNWFVAFLPKGFLDVALVVHYWEAWLATLAIIVWHLYSVIFSPHVYPMNPSWLTGMMPEAMYRREHPGHLEQARRETRAFLERQMARIAASDNGVERWDEDDAPEEGARPTLESLSETSPRLAKKMPSCSGPGRSEGPVRTES
ncbi:MAG: cytochrome b/b6 domain-containing protein [Planctomycetota bacterium]